MLLGHPQLGMTAVAVAELLGISQSAATRAAYRSEAIAAANGLELPYLPIRFHLIFTICSKYNSP
jgi:hypothetical protein